MITSSILTLFLLFGCSTGFRGIPASSKPSVSRLHMAPVSRVPLLAGAGPRALPLVALGALLTLSNAIKVVRQSDLALIERFGKFHVKLDPGLHFLIPFVDVVRATVTEREQVLDVPPQKCITSDNAPLVADAVVYWKIFDAEKSVYSVANLELAIQNLVLTQLRAEIGKLTLDSTFSAREQVNAVLLKDLDLATDPWGVKITRVEVRDIIPNKEILQAMELQMASERKKRAMITASEGEQAKAINIAEGEAQSRVIEAESMSKSVKLAGEAEAARLTYEAKGARTALEELTVACKNDVNLAVRTQLMREFVDAQKSLATSNNSKVIMTSGNADEFFSRASTMIDATKTTRQHTISNDESSSKSM